jgi:hypothetical protein
MTATATTTAYAAYLRRRRAGWPFRATAIRGTIASPASQGIVLIEYVRPSRRGGSLVVAARQLLDV